MPHETLDSYSRGSGWAIPSLSEQSLIPWLPASRSSSATLCTSSAMLFSRMSQYLNDYIEVCYEGITSACRSQVWKWLGRSPVTKYSNYGKLPAGVLVWLEAQKLHPMESRRVFAGLHLPTGLELEPLPRPVKPTPESRVGLQSTATKSRMTASLED